MVTLPQNTLKRLKFIIFSKTQGLRITQANYLSVLDKKWRLEHLFWLRLQVGDVKATFELLSLI